MGTSLALKLPDQMKSPANMLIEGTLPITSPTDPASLIMYNKMGDSALQSGTALYNGINWAYFDNSLTVDGYSSGNMEAGDRSADVPT